MARLPRLEVLTYGPTKLPQVSLPSRSLMGTCCITWVFGIRQYAVAVRVFSAFKYVQMLSVR